MVNKPLLLIIKFMNGINKIRKFVLDERDKIAKTTGDFNSLNDEYREGYWIAMNTAIKYIDRLINK